MTDTHVLISFFFLRIGQTQTQTKTLFTSYKSVRKYYPDKTQYNKVALGIINAKFYSLNYNENDENNGGLKLVNDIFQPIEGKKAFNEHDILIAAPLIDFAMGETINFVLKKELLFEAANRKIKNITVDFGTNTTYTVYENNQIIKPEVFITYRTGGYKQLVFKITFQNGTTFTTYGKLHVKIPAQTQDRGPSSNLIDNVIGFNSTIPSLMLFFN